MNSGIYSITNIENGKRYIGRTIDFKKREGNHFGALKSGRHPNVHLQRAWDSGQEFRFEVIERCDPEDLNEREIFWISKYQSMENGYNLCEGGAATLGRVCTDETKKKISKANTGRKVSREVIEKRTASLRKRLQEDEEFAKRHFQQLSERWKGKPSWNKGMPCPEWKKQLLREKLKGRNVTDEHKDKLRQLFSGENSITAKLTEQDVIMIRLRFLNGERQIDIQKDYGVTPQTIYDIVRGRRWKCVPMTKPELEKLLREREEKNGKNSKRNLN